MAAILQDPPEITIRTLKLENKVRTTILGKVCTALCYCIASSIIQMSKMKAKIK